MYCIEMAPFLRLINAKNVDAIKSGSIQRPDQSATGCIQAKKEGENAKLVIVSKFLLFCLGC